MHICAGASICPSEMQTRRGSDDRTREVQIRYGSAGKRMTRYPARRVAWRSRCRATRASDALVLSSAASASARTLPRPQPGAGPAARRSRTGDPLGTGDLAHRPFLDSDSSNDKPGFRHPGTTWPTSAPAPRRPSIVVDGEETPPLCSPPAPPWQAGQRHMGRQSGCAHPADGRPPHLTPRCSGFELRPAGGASTEGCWDSSASPNVIYLIVPHRCAAEEEVGP